MSSTVPTKTDTVERAQTWAKYGFHVFPVEPRGKAPATPNGHKAASADPEQVREMFRDRPDANIGLVPGRSGHVVVDVDSEAGETALQRLWGEIPDTVSWTTGKGRHRLYRTPVPLRSRNRVGPDLDVKANGGYVVVPPSIHPSGAAYTFEDGPTKAAKLSKEQAASLSASVESGPMPEQENLRAPSMEALRGVVAAIPNEGEAFAARDAYLKVGYAIKAAAGSEHEAEALELFQSWAARWEDGENDPDRVRTDFEGMHGPYRVGFEYLADLADPYDVAAEEFEATEPAPSGPFSEFLSQIQTAAELVAEPRPPITYVLQDTLAAGRVSILAAPPKKGKSTFGRSLGTAVANGEEWCGLETTEGRVLYVALEEHRDDVAADLEMFGAEEARNFDTFIGPAPDDLVGAIRAAIQERGGYSLIVIDTLFRGVRTEDGNAYMDTVASLDDVIALAHETNAHVLCVHHTRKGIRLHVGDPFEGILGSTGIWASFDAGMVYLSFSWGEEDDRALVIDGRRHVEAQTRIIRQLPNGHLVSEGTFAQYRSRALYRHLLQHGPLDYEETAEGLGWGESTVKRYMPYLEERGQVERKGEGVKGDPYLWAAVEAETEFEADVDLSDLGEEGEAENG